MLIPDIPKISIQNIDCDHFFIKRDDFGVYLNVCKEKKSAMDNFCFSGMSLWRSEDFFEKKFIKLNSVNEPILVEISNLSEQLGIPKQDILDADQNDSINDLISMGIEAKQYQISYSEVLDFKNRAEIGHLRILEYYADSFHLPLSELLRAQQQGTLNKLLQEAQEVEIKCYSTFAKLDRLYEEQGGKLFTKDTDEKIKGEMKLEELEKIKAVVRSAYKILSRHPKGTTQKIEQIISITERHHILVESNNDSLKITGLFGAYLGSGALGVVVRTIDLLEGTWGIGNEAVLKIPQVTDLDSEQILQEVALIKKIHGTQQILGIQKPLGLLKDVFTGISTHCHLGFLYETDLFNIVLHPDKKKILSSEHQISLAYQLVHGISHMHNKNITSGDIKPENIFCDFTNNEQENLLGPRLFLSDFGGGIDHSKDSVPLQLVTSPEYRLNQDDIASEKAYKEENRKLYEIIEKKADVFAACSVICSIFTNEKPYKISSESGECTVNKDLLQQLLNAGLSSETADLLIQGLEFDYEKRPDAIAIMKSITKNELNKINSNRKDLLLKISQPL